MTTVPRPSSSLVSFWALVVIGALFVGDTVLRGDAHGFAITTGPVLVVIWAGWMILYRPSVSFDSAGVVVVNPGRRISVPWARIVSVRQRFQILLELDDGKTITCWGSPFPEKPGRLRPDRSRPSVAAGAAVAPLEAERLRAADRPSDARIERRWDTVPLAVGAVLVVISVVDFVFAR